MLSVRLTPDEAAVVRRAAEHLDEPLSEFMRRALVGTAGAKLAEPAQPKGRVNPASVSMRWFAR